MTLDYVLVPVGLICLGVPATLFTPSKVKEKMRSGARRREDCFKSLVRMGCSPGNWIDLVRAGVGAWAIQHVLSAAKSGQDELALTYMVAKLALIALCAAAQTVWLDRPLRVIGPLFYLTSLSLVFCGPLVAGFALTLGLGCAFILRHMSLVFVLVPAGLVAFGALFRELDLMTIAVAVAFSLPAFLSFALRTRITYAFKPIDVVVAVASETGAEATTPAAPEVPTENLISPDFTNETIEMSDGFVA